MEENKINEVDQLKKELEESKKVIANMYQQQAGVNNLLKRLEILFTVIQYSDKFNEEFVAKCVAEIENMITIEETKAE